MTVEIKETVLVLVDFKDGCQLRMNPTDGKAEGWTLEMPGGRHC